MFSFNCQPATIFVAFCGVALFLNEPWTQRTSAAESAAEVSELLAQASKLETAANECREKVRSKEMSDCKVEVTFQNNRLISPAAADALAVQLRIQAHQKSYARIEQLNAEQARNTYDYFRIIDHFAVATNPLYAASNSATYCNLFTQDVMKAMGAPLPQLLANDTFRWLSDETKGGAQGWHQLSADQAQAMANEGHPTIAIWSNPNGGHGHLAVVRPGSVGDERGDAEAQAGRRGAILNATHVARGFNNVSGQKSITYWSHP
jgi:hypothetical protein